MKLYTEGSTRPPPNFNTMQIFRNKPVQASPVLRAGPFAIHTYPQGSVASSSGGESSFPNIRGIKKSLPQLSSSANILSKNISSTTEKVMYILRKNLIRSVLLLCCVCGVMVFIILSKLLNLLSYLNYYFKSMFVF